MAVSPDVLAEVCGPDILGRIASVLPPNEVACTLRLVSRFTAEHFLEHTVVRLSEPSPAAAFTAHWSAPGICRALPYKRRWQLLSLMAASGDVGNLEAALAAAGLCPTVEVMEAAAAAGHLHVCRWLAERGCPLEGPDGLSSPLAAAARNGHAAMCEWLLEQGCAWEPQCVTAAARGGHLELTRALLRKAPPGPGGNVPTDHLLSAAAEGCDLGTLQELWRERAVEGSAVVDWESLRSSAVCAAARSPTPDWAAKVAWLLEQGAERHRGVCWAATSCPDALARLTLLVEGMGLPVDASEVDAAVERGRADAVRWLLARGFRPTAVAVMGQRMAAVRWAAEWGHTEVLRALHAAGCELLPPRDLMVHACTSGSVETARWVVETFGAEALGAAAELPSVPSPFDAALRSGSLELVTWLWERGVGPDHDPWDSAARGGCRAVLKLLAGGDADPEDTSPFAYPYVTAAKRGDVLILEALWCLGLPLGSTRQEWEALVDMASGDAPVPARGWLQRAVAAWGSRTGPPRCRGLRGWAAGL